MIKYYDNLYSSLQTLKQNERYLTKFLNEILNNEFDCPVLPSQINRNIQAKLNVNSQLCSE